MWELDDRRRAEVVTDRLESNFYTRCPPERRPVSLRLPENNKDTDTIDTSDATAGDGNDEKGLGELEAGAASPDPENKNASNINTSRQKGKGKKELQYDSSLPFAIQKTFFFHFWLSGCLYAIGGAFSHSLNVRATGI